MAELSELRINGKRLWASIMSMAEIGPGVAGGSCRLALTDVDREGRDLFVKWCIDAVSEAVSGLGYTNQQIISGAGHDACQVCQVVPTAMIIVPCAGGLSHNEQESAEPDDLEAGCNVLLQAMLKLAN